MGSGQPQRRSRGFCSAMCRKVSVHLNLCSAMVFLCKTNPQISLFNSFTRFGRKGGEVMLRVTQSLRLVLSNPTRKETGKGKREVGGELGFLELLATHTGKIKSPSLSQ